MRSFDLFGTLAAGRNPAIRDGDQDGHFPIAENVAKVRRGDLIISDYYDEAKAQRIVEEVCGLSNQLLVSTSGKASGNVWRYLQSCGLVPELHIGDDPLTDLASPRAQGVNCQLVILGGMTVMENELHGRGFPGLAQLMREARLATWHDEKLFRDLQLFQAQVNLPFLFLASILVHRRMEKFQRLLMSARDCWLWYRLYSELLFCGAFPDAAYHVKYFLTSRLTRYFPSDNYKLYLNEQCSVPSLIVDLCGFGRSLLRLREDVPNAESLLLVGYEGYFTPCLIPGWLNETTNFARHPMVADVDAQGDPVYANPLYVDWEKIPELAIMHEVFLRGVSAVPEYDFAKDMQQSTEDVNAALASIFSHFDDYVQPLGLLTAFRVDEARATADLINSRGSVEGVVV